MVDAFVVLGCSVVTLPAVVAGLPDLLVGCAGACHLVEVKATDSRHGKRGLAEAQSEFAATWRGEAPALVRTVEDVQALVAAWRKAPRP